ncbi:MAG: isoprenylcysteine carboxylmethyltransferase family protein [Rhodocyclaceae bacterium]|nr:isoprenylcysteine carboxylmethyltransferase family protein [Rhodocyclaceae bacterium]
MPHPHASTAGAPLRLAGLLYGVAAYAAFNGVVLYCVGFLGNFLVPLSIDAGRAPDAPGALPIDLALLALFGVQHSLMARPGFKAWMTRRVHASLERATYVVLSSAALAFVMWQWRPLPAIVWQVDAAWAQTALWLLFAAGWTLALAATFFTDHFELLGVKQALAYFRGRPYVPGEFREAAVYRWVRHPIMLGQIVAFWATPTMSAGHLLFAAAMLAYTLVGLYFEERDLVAAHGDAYRDYQRRTPKLIPRPPRPQTRKEEHR